jgi:hypothetical protein
MTEKELHLWRKIYVKIHAGAIYFVTLIDWNSLRGIGKREIELHVEGIIAIANYTEASTEFILR